MTIGEFKAFLDGMNVDKAPTPEEWARILEKVDTLAEPVSFPLSPSDLVPDPRRFWADPLSDPSPWPGGIKPCADEPKGTEHFWDINPYTVTC